MDPQEETELKNIIRGLLISNPHRSTQQQLWRDYKEMIGQAVPLRKLGFRTFDEYLRAIPDVVQVYGNGPMGEVEAVTSKSQHLKEMVLKQKKSTPKYKKFCNRAVSTFHHKSPRFYQHKYPLRLPPSPSTHYGNNSFVEPPQQVGPINGRFSHTPNSITCMSPQVEEKSYKPHHGSGSLVEFPLDKKKPTNDHPPLITTSNTYMRPPAEDKIYKPNLHFNHRSQHQEDDSSDTSSRRSQRHFGLAFSDKSPTSAVSSFKKSEKSKVDTELSSAVDHSSRVPVRVQNNLCNLIENFPDGVECTRLPTEYRAMYNKNIHYEEYGYRSLIEMCSDLPEIFHYIQHSSHDYMLYDRKRPIPSQDFNKNSTKPVYVEKVVRTHILEDLPNVNWKSSAALLPTDVFTINDQLSRFFPADVKEEDILDIKIGEIYDLSKFWFYMTYGDLDPLMDKLQIFFEKNAGTYLIPEVLLEEGLYCVALYGDLYHRCAIVDLLPNVRDTVRVFFIDYGTVENVCSKEIWFLPKQFGEVPGQAIRGRLSNIYPVYENQPWPTSAVRRFEELITKRVVVGKVTKIDERDHLLELYLADITNKDEIFYLNKIFVDEGHALHIGDERKKSLVDVDCLPNVRYIHLYPEFYEIEAGMAPTTEEKKYIFANRIPLHHYMPQYFDIYYKEDINEILLDYDRIGRKRKKNIVIPTVELQFDFSFFPDHLVDEIKELYLQDHPEAEVEIPRCKVSLKDDNCESQKILQGTTGASKAENSDGKNSRDAKSASDLEKSAESVSHFFQHVALNDDSSLATASPRILTNPFISDCTLSNTNPFRTTNPFLSNLDLEESVNTSQLIDLFAKPSDDTLPNKIVNNLKGSQCHCKKDKQVNVDRSSQEPPSSVNNVSPNSETTCQRVRTPPGFSSNSGANSMPTPVMANSFCNSVNPYYQRFPFQNGSVQQNPVMPYVLPLQGNYFGLPQAYSNPYSFSAANYPQLYPQANFGAIPRFPQ